MLQRLPGHLNSRRPPLIPPAPLSAVRIGILSLIFAVALAASMRAQEVRFSGFGATGIRMYDRNPVAEFNQEYFYEGKLQADIRLSKKIDAQLDFRGDSDERTVVLREFSVKFDYFTYARIKLGNVKKPFSVEGLADRDEYIPVFDSHLHRRNEELGYAGRNVGLLVYYNANLEKRPELPFSWAAGVFKNNSYLTSAYARGSWHSGSWTTSLGYALLSRSHDDAVTTQGISADFGYRTPAFESQVEAMLIQDPDEQIRRRLLGQDDAVWSPGVRSLTAFRIPVDGDIVETVEPYLLLGWSAPDAETTEWHRLEIMAGVNVFVDDDVRLRLTADGLLTRDRYSDDYSTHGSVFSFEVFIRF